MSTKSINRRFNNLEKMNTKQQNALAKNAINAANSTANSQNRAAYVAYNQNQKDMPQQLARMGLSGGASETSSLKNQTNYQNTRNSIASDQAKAISDAKTSAANNIAAFKTETVQRRQNALDAYQKQAESRYANTISGYDNIKKIDKLIKKISKSGKSTWKISYLRAQKAALKAAAKKK